MITIHNIEAFRGDLPYQCGDLPFDIWQVFDQAKYHAGENHRLIRLSEIHSPKNELEDPDFLAGRKPDPRRTAFERMFAAINGSGTRRGPIQVTPRSGGGFSVIDGNATVQVLMLVKWEQVPAIVDMMDMRIDPAAGLERSNNENSEGKVLFL